MENGNFNWFAANERKKIANFCLFAANINGKQKFSLFGKR